MRFSWRDRRMGSSASTIEDINMYWRYIILRDDEVISMARNERDAQLIVDALNDYGMVE